MRTIKTQHLKNNLWLTTYNLWICDIGHSDTCQMWITSVKPTPRQVRKFKKNAKSNFRYGTRTQQRERAVKFI